jgi:hypothetical protein
MSDNGSGGEIETGRTPFHDALRAALATAKEKDHA